MRCEELGNMKFSVWFLFEFYFYATGVNSNVFFGLFILGTAESFSNLLTDVSFLQCEQSLLLVQY